MEAEQVVEKILADANAEADKIKKESEEKQASEQVRLKEQLGEFDKQTEMLAAQAGKDEKSHLLAAARMEIAKELLGEKRKILEEVFEQVRGQMRLLPDEEYRPLITKLMIDAVETGDEEVVIDNEERRIDVALIEEVNRSLGAERQGSLRLSEQREPLGGGFILRRGKVKNNVSLETLLTQARKELEIELAKELFAD